MYKNIFKKIALSAFVLLCAFASQATLAVPVSDKMEIHVIPNVGSTPVTINLDNVYNDAIPVCTYNLPSASAPPSVVRINSIGSTTMSIKLGLLEDAPGAVATPSNVHCVIVEEGLWSVNGVPIEARKVLSTDTVGRNLGWNPANNNSGWENKLEDVTSLITHPFVNPVVLGQVITSNDPLASIYYANNCSRDRRAIPFSGGGGICVGKHISKEVSTRADEYIGIIIAGTTDNSGASGSTGGFRAGTTTRFVAGVDNNPPYSWNTVENYSVGVVSQLGERGGDGAWAVLYGDDPLANSQINLAIEESEINNNSRAHTTEVVNYLVVTVPTITLQKVVDNTGGGALTESDFNLSFSGVTNNSGVSGSPNVTNFPVQPGTYTITENTLAQYLQTDLSCAGGVLNGNELQLSAFDSATCTFTNTYQSVAPTGVSISGNVFEDLNSNNTLDGLEQWANGVSVFVNIVDAGVVLQSVQVNPGAGDYSFSEVPPGNYDIILSDSQINVSPVVPAGWVFNSPSSGIQPITVAGSNITAQNFALFHAPILSATKTAVTPTVVNTPAGTTADYQITLSNTASIGGDAISVQISDVLPAGFIYNSASTVITTAATGNCLVAASRNSTVDPVDGASGTITWGDWTVPAGCTVVIDFGVDIPSTVADGIYDNSVSLVTATSPAVINNFDGSLYNDENVTVTSAVLSVTKASLIQTAAAGGEVSYQVIVSNDGTAPATAVEITDVLPQLNGYFTYGSTTSITGSHTRTAINNPTAAATSPVWGTFDIPASGSVILEFVVNIDAAAPDSTYHNSVNVTSSNAKSITNYDGSDTSNTTDDINIATTSPVTDLSITKTDGLTAAIPGNTITYSIVVTNTGIDVTGAGVTDVFDPAIFDVANVTWNCSITAGTGACAIAGPATGNINTTVDLTAGSVATFNVTAAPIHSNATGVINNIAQVAPPSGVIDSDVNNNSALDNDTVLVPTGDLIVTKDDGISSVVAGTNTTYTITVNNAGPSDMLGATLTDTFDPVDVNVQNVTWTCAVDAGSVGACGAISGSGDISTSLDLTAGSTATLTATVPVLETAVSPLDNTVNILEPGGFTESDNASNTAVDSNVVSSPQADLEITKITSNGAPGLGANFTYTVSLLNKGGSAATNVVVTDTFSSNQINFVSATASQGAGATRTVQNISPTEKRWTIPYLPAGNTATLVITANISTAGIHTNTAEVTFADQDDPDSTFNNGVLTEDDMDSIDVNAGGILLNADLRISKTDGVTSAIPGSTVTYTITVTNDAASTDDVVGLTVEDIFDPVFFDVANVSWTCAITVGTGVCGSPGPVLGDIASTVDLTVGSAATFTVTAPIWASATGTISNTATVAVPTGVTDSVQANNTAFDSNTVLVSEADLSLTKTVNNTSPTVGDTVVFTVEVSNAGPSDANNVIVRDILPSGFSFDLAGTSATQGSYSIATGDWTVGTLSTSAPVQTLTLSAVASATGTYLNRAQVWVSAANDPDSTPANNVSSEDDHDDLQLLVQVANIGVSITGRVFDDRDVSGLFNAGDSGIADIGVVLRDIANDTCVATRTDANGGYAFESVLDGSYNLYESAQSATPVPVNCPPLMADPNGYLSVTSNELLLNISGADIAAQDFADAREPVLTGNHSADGDPGGSVVYPHTFTAQADGNVDFSIAATPVASGWSSIVYRDSNCNAQLDSGDPVLNGSTAVVADERVCLLVKVFVPSNAASRAQHISTLTASYTFADPSGLGHGLSSNRQREDITTATTLLSGKLELYKTVRNVDELGAESVSNSAEPGQVLRYNITFANTGSGTISDLLINDVTPAFTTTSGPISCPATLPASLSNCTVQVPSPANNVAGYEGRIVWRFDGTLAAGAEGELSFDVAVE